MKSFYQQKKILFALCLSAALALGACGGDDSSSGESDITQDEGQGGDGDSAIGGSVEVSAFSHDDGDAFEATLHDIELVEVSEDYRGNHDRVDGGAIGCLDTLALEATTELRAPFPESGDIACDHNGFPHPSDSGSMAVITPMI